MDRGRPRRNSLTLLGFPSVHTTAGGSRNCIKDASDVTVDLMGKTGGDTWCDRLKDLKLPDIPKIAGFAVGRPGMSTGARRVP